MASVRTSPDVPPSPKSMKRRAQNLLGSILSLFVLPSAVLHAATLEFDDVSLFGGSLTYGGADGVDPLEGVGIVFDLVNGIGTTPSGPLEIVGGSLDFHTGPNLSEGAVVYEFAGGGDFTLSGTVIKPDLSVVASGVLLAGHFTGISVVIGLGGGNGLFSGLGVDEKNPDLIAYYGLSATPFEFANTEIGFAVAGLEADGGFVAAVLDSDLTNQVSLIPEGKSLFGMIGLGMAMLVGIRYRDCLR